MGCERRINHNLTHTCTHKRIVDLEELLHDQDIDALYIELMLSSDEAIESILHDLEADI